MGYANTPKFLGDATFTALDGNAYTQIIMQTFVHNQGDAWLWTLDRLGRAIQPTSYANIAIEALAVENASPMEELTGFATILGQRLAELHNALATPSNDPAFTPEAMNEAKIAAWRQRITSQLLAALDILNATTWQNELDANNVATLVSQKNDLLQLIDALLKQSANCMQTRVHGDFHLGQVLVISGDVMIIDFEGEPTRTLEERREKDCPLRDVAGLMRSFSYAAAFIEKSDNASPTIVDDTNRQQLLQLYLGNSQAAFMQAYCQTYTFNETYTLTGIRPKINKNTMANPQQTLPYQLQAVLNLYMLEKVSYEIGYEAANRPNWLSVPLQGLIKLVQSIQEFES